MEKDGHAVMSPQIEHEGQQQNKMGLWLGYFMIVEFHSEEESRTAARRGRRRVT